MDYTINYYIRSVKQSTTGTISFYKHLNLWTKKKYIIQYINDAVSANTISKSNCGQFISSNVTFNKHSCCVDCHFKDKGKHMRNKKIEKCSYKRSTQSGKRIQCSKTQNSQLKWKVVCSHNPHDRFQPYSASSKFSQLASPLQKTLKRRV